MKKVNKNLTSFRDHFDQQYGKRGTAKREKYEETPNTLREFAQAKVHVV